MMQPQLGYTYRKQKKHLPSARYWSIYSPQY
jgi:hypothetical protein